MTSVKREVDELLRQLRNGERDLDDLNESETVESLNRLAYNHSIKFDGDTGKLYAFSIHNLREEYHKKFLMTSLIGFLYRQNDEYGVPDGDYVVPVEELDKEEITREFIEENVINGKVVLKEEVKTGVSGGENYTQDESVANKYRRMVIREFLDNLFVFNPDKHVRSAYSRNTGDPERKPVKPHKRSKKSKKVDVRSDEKLTREERNLREYGRVTGKIPPVDLFHNYKYYMESNYDALRIATRDLYCEKPDIDFTIKIYNDFKTKEEYNDFVHKYEERVTAEVKCCEQNKWAFLSPFSQNRDRQMFYNRNTRVLQEILDSAEQGQRLGKDMMQKRIRKKKQQNVEECGVDDKKFIENYRKEQRDKHKKAGFREVSETDRKQQELEEKYLSRYDKPSDDIDDYNAIEVQTWTLDTKSKKLKPDSFFTEAEDVNQDTSTIIGGK